MSMMGMISLFVEEADEVQLAVRFDEDGDLWLTFGGEGSRGGVEVYMRRDQAEAIAEMLAAALADDANKDGKGKANE